MYSITIIIFLLLALAVIAYSILRKKQIIDEPPNRFAASLFIFLLFFSLCFVIAVSTGVLYIVSLGVNFLFGEQITYDSFFFFDFVLIIRECHRRFLVSYSSIRRQRASLFT